MCRDDDERCVAQSVSVSSVAAVEGCASVSPGSIRPESGAVGCGQVHRQLWSDGRDVGSMEKVCRWYVVAASVNAHHADSRERMLVRSDFKCLRWLDHL